MTTQTIQTNLVGITFRVKDNPEIGKLRPEGEVELRPEPENKHDKLAIAVY